MVTDSSSLVTSAQQVRQDEPHSPFLRDVIVGLTAQPKRLPPKYFYDEIGARLFEAITALPEYYPTRCELHLLSEHGAEIAQFFPAGAALIEFGSGSSRKIRTVLAAAPTIKAYVPVDVSAEMLVQEAEQLRRDHPGLTVLPLAADFTSNFVLPSAVTAMPRVGFFPGSTIGNFEPRDAVTFLRHAASILGHGAVLIVGVDLIKDAHLLDAAYNDAAGVTAAFNFNLLTRINRELGADFDLRHFTHRAFYNVEKQRVEMHLRSTVAQDVSLAGRVIHFAAGETIHTENSYKYTLASFAALARAAGWKPAAVWTDKEFSVHALRLSAHPGAVPSTDVGANS
ncbi:MAG: L-histidine N(alpha)-methyltransferase [Xanthobacteraceae bacterium]